MKRPRHNLDYPHRRQGMDHDLYDWSMLPDRPPVQWPGGAHLAAWPVVVVEWFPLTSRNTPFRPPSDQYVGVRPYPDYRAYSHLEYGNRVGIYRVLRALESAGVRASVAMNAAIAERYPEIIDAVVGDGHEVIAHGLDMEHVHHGDLPRAEERTWVRQALKTLREASGQPVTGWLSPDLSQSMNTLDLLAAEGVEYVCDWVNDDLPYALRTKSGALHAMPFAYELSDRLVLLDLRHSEAQFDQQIRDTHAVLLREAALHGGRIMALTFHAWITGHPHRIGFFEDMLAWLQKRESTWTTTGAEILAAFKDQG